jgi:putative nucleotidyltransferase with HDIG domain
MTQAATATIKDDGHEQRAQIVDAAIRDISHIATLPEITLKIIRLVEDPNSTAQDLNKIISNDPALGARVLKVVNSAFYGLPGQIASINRAIVLLGLNAVKNIAVAASLAKLFRGGQICPSFSARDLWTHSIAVATATRLMANRAGLGLPDEAFLAGLIHDIGIMVEMQAQRTGFIKVIAAMDADPALAMRQAEETILGASHEDFGAGLCRSWKFPKSFIYVTAHHHRPMDLVEEHRPLTGLVHLADVLASRDKIGFARSVEIHEFRPDLLTQFGLTLEDIEAVSEELPEAMAEAVALLQDQG